MTRILFVNIPAISLKGLEQLATSKNINSLPVVMPLGILYLSACTKLNSVGNEVQLLDYCAGLDRIKGYAGDTNQYFIDIAREKVTVPPDVISITLNFACMYDTFSFCAELLRRLFPKACIMVGGIQASNAMDHLLKNTNIDYVVCGEGEVAFPRCIDHYRSGTPLTEVKGVYSSKKLPLKPPVMTDLVVDLDEIPYPDWSILDMDCYSRNESGWTHDTDVNLNTRVASIMTSRGCIYHCTFCSAHTIHGRKMRGRSIENVVGEVKTLNEKYGINRFTFIDDLITYDKKRLIDLMKAVKSLGIENFKIEFPNALSINTIDNDIIDLMVESGVSTIILALESGSRYTQHHIIRKNVRFDKTVAIIDYIRKKHPAVGVRCNLLLGFPHETKQLMQESLDFVKTLALDWVRFFAAVPLPGSEMYQQFVEMGAIRDSPESWETVHFGFGSRVFDTPEISAKDLNDLIYRANLDVNFKNNYNLLVGNTLTALKHFKEVVKTYDFQIVGWLSILDCYEELNDVENVKKTKAKIDQLLTSDERAIEIYRNYVKMES